jgi:hypothetical protein
VSLLFLLLLLSSNLQPNDKTPHKQEPRAGRWLTLAPMNAAHEYHAAAAADGKVYVVGGTGPVTLEQYAQSYRPFGTAASRSLSARRHS